MKKLSVIIVAFSLFGSVTCSTVEGLMSDTNSMKGLASNIPATTSIGGVDFKRGEVLCGWYEDSSLMNNSYYAAKILTPATPATKNQAEVLFVKGEKKWIKTVLPSHKAQKSELGLNKIVLFHGYGYRKDMKQDLYRKGSWRLGRITSTDELFKGIVEIKGKKYNIKWIRVTNQPLHE
ncbi:MAG: hypothetical protein SVZ03_10650 [Spirochaetota bacterium]|nr:hypothetical protein [Spirochaetota bacterium]